MSNESLINLLKKQLDLQFRLEALARGSTSSNGCEICHAKDHMGNDCPRYATFRPKCQKCRGLHKTENCGLRCVFLRRTWAYIRVMWGKKGFQTWCGHQHYLEVLVDDEKRCKFNLIRIRYVKTTMIYFCTLWFLCGGYIWTQLPEKKHKIQSLPMKKWDGGEK